MIARISSPFDDELAAAGCTGTACGASATLSAGVLLLLLVSARGSSGNTRAIVLVLLVGVAVALAEATALMSVLVSALLARQAFASPSSSRAWAQSVATASAPSVARSALQQTARVARAVAGARLTTRLTGASRWQVAQLSVVAVERFDLSAPPLGHNGSVRKLNHVLSGHVLLRVLVHRVVLLCDCLESTNELALVLWWSLC